MLFRRYLVFLFLSSVACFSTTTDYDDYDGYSTTESVTSSDGFSTTVFPIADGPSCENIPKKSWLDLAVVVECSHVTLTQWTAIYTNILSYLSRLTIADTGDHTTRVSIITYNHENATVVYSFTDPQNLNRIHIALKNAISTTKLGESAKIFKGFRLAKDEIDRLKGFRIPGVVLYAATYDDSGDGNPLLASQELKMDMVKIVTISFEASNGVATPQISALASPGLALTSRDPVKNFGWAVGQLNCICPAGWTQLVIGSQADAKTYSDCFFTYTAQVLPAFTNCPQDNNLATVYTPNRLDFLRRNMSYSIEGGAFSVGLVRTDGDSPWYWQTYIENITYTNYPEFVAPPAATDAYGYLQLVNGDWKLFSDDGMTNSRPYICQTRSCDTNYVCDMQGNKHY
uniref:VWFA domain-containing protein n=1 Tax=Panagrellus redivivus TaxID=6233 RepID=A0A7E4VJ44_PANRE